MYVSFMILLFLARHQLPATPDTSPGNELDGDHRHSVGETDDPATELRVSAGDDETAGVTTGKSTSLTETGNYTL